jgi:hypothetical protein
LFDEAYNLLTMFYHLFERLLTMFLYMLTIFFPGCWPGCGLIYSANRNIISITSRVLVERG